MNCSRKIMQLEIEEAALKKEEDQSKQGASGKSAERTGRAAGTSLPDQESAVG